MNTSRQQLYTKVAPYQDRQDAWNAAIKATKKQINYGEFLQGKAQKLLEGIQNVQNAFEVEKGIKLLQQALSSLEKGIKIERESREALMQLYQHQPKEKS